MSALHAELPRSMQRLCFQPQFDFIQTESHIKNEANEPNIIA